MMMPANFSAISENEMTYVNGGGLAEILAPELTVKEWQNFNKNMVTIIGNSFVNKYVENTVGTLFGGSYAPGAMGKAWFGDVKGYYDAGYKAGFGKHTGELTAGDKFLNGGNGVLNAGLRMVGSAAAIYNLATGTVKNAVSENVLSFPIVK